MADQSTPMVIDPKPVATAQSDRGGAQGAKKTKRPRRGKATVVATKPPIDGARISKSQRKVTETEDDVSPRWQEASLNRLHHQQTPVA